jgi:CHAP domain
MISRTWGALQDRYDQMREVLLKPDREHAMRMGVFILTPIVFVLVLWIELGPIFAPHAPAHPVTPWVAPVKAYAPAWFDSAKQQGFTTHGQYLAAQAISLSNSIYGNANDEYYADDPAMNPAVAYWKSVCQDADGTVCADAKSGNLQCVEFVAAVFAMSDDELPAINDANRLWSLYQNKAGWQEIPANAVQKQIPALGDMVTWSGGQSGHLAMVVDVQPPTQGKDGSITVVQTEATDLFDTLTWHANGQIDSLKGYTLQGFIRQQQLASCLQQQSTPQQQQWETLAVQAAVHYGTPSKYLLQQICQSGFQATGSSGQAVISPGGGVGIAQMSPQLAAQVPRCVIDVIHNAANCPQMPGSLPAGNGIDPNKPEEALPAAAYEMSVLYTHYRQNKTAQGPQSELQAYSMALAAYHDGPALVDKAVNSCQKQGWLNCLNQWQPSYYTQEYIDAVLGTRPSDTPYGSQS